MTKMIGALVRACVGVSLVPAAAVAVGPVPSDRTPRVIVSTDHEPIAPGKFQPTWQSLAQYKTPDWFRDAKFGIWAHWGPQCQPEQGDWYARNMYLPGNHAYQFQTKTYGHPSVAGFKDVIHAWKAERWDPDELVRLYKRAGAQYFFAMANHHDNLDLWASKYQPWNSTRVGPEKDLIAGWAKAARANGLKFGVSVHAAHAWSWYEVAQGSDKTGPRAGVPYDGKLTAADGHGTWWDGLDPQALYAQNHTPATAIKTGDQWNWGNGSTTPDLAYCQKFYDRTIDLINQAKPDLIYFDDTALPLWPVSDAGLKIAAHFYNSKALTPGGDTQAVMFGKILDTEQRRCLVMDIERGQSNHIEPEPWQSDTCLGNWHYDRSVYDRNRYKSAATVLRTLADVVSKNGSLLLNVPVRGDGSIDEKERAIVEGVAAWMDVNKEAILGTRPWRVCGEGPQLARAPAPVDQGFNEGKAPPATPADVRYTRQGKTVYAVVLVPPTDAVRLTELASSKDGVTQTVTAVEQLGAGSVTFVANAEALVITAKPVAGTAADGKPVVFKISMAD